jgi:hypothetical protein
MNISLVRNCPSSGMQVAVSECVARIEHLHADPRWAELATPRRLSNASSMVAAEIDVALSRGVSDEGLAALGAELIVLGTQLAMLSPERLPLLLARGVESRERWLQHARCSHQPSSLDVAQLAA